MTTRIWNKYDYARRVLRVSTALNNVEVLTWWWENSYLFLRTRNVITGKKCESFFKGVWTYKFYNKDDWDKTIKNNN